MNDSKNGRASTFFGELYSTSVLWPGPLVFVYRADSYKSNKLSYSQSVEKRCSITQLKCNWISQLFNTSVSNSFSKIVSRIPSGRRLCFYIFVFFLIAPTCKSDNGKLFHEFISVFNMLTKDRKKFARNKYGTKFIE